MTENKIALTYLNVRQSIAILLAKIIFLDLLLAGVVIIFYFALIQGERFIVGLAENIFLFLIIFSLVGFIKILITTYVVLQWLFEYYEITPEYVVHRHGIIFRKQEHYSLATIRGMEIKDSFLGQVFNFGTITFYDNYLNKRLDMQLIHNAKRYGKIFKQLQPRIELKEDQVWMPLKKEETISNVE